MKTTTKAPEADPQVKPNLPGAGAVRHQKQPANRKRTNSQRALDLEEVAKLSLGGFSQRAIAEKMKELRPYTLTHQQIAYDLKEIEAEWMNRAQVSIAAKKAKELALLEYVADEALDAWKEARKKKGQKHAAARFLNVIRECSADRRKILGLDKPSRMELTGPDGKPLEMASKMDFGDEDHLVKFVEAHLKETKAANAAALVIPPAPAS